MAGRVQMCVRCGRTWPVAGRGRKAPAHYVLAIRVYGPNGRDTQAGIGAVCAPCWEEAGVGEWIDAAALGVASTLRKAPART